jgi:hypothetical protein
MLALFCQWFFEIFALALSKHSDNSAWCEARADKLLLMCSLNVLPLPLRHVQSFEEPQRLRAQGQQRTKNRQPLTYDRILGT